jgi:AcrR family transcriptional regulator
MSWARQDHDGMPESEHVREQQRLATRQRILRAAVESFQALGYAATTTLEVQRRAGVSRGALLHHFPTRPQLVAAAIAELVRLNDAASKESLARTYADLDPIERARQALRSIVSRPAFGIEMELWMAARSDAELRTHLRKAERSAMKDWQRGLDEMFGPEIVAHPAYPSVIAVTTPLIRGLAVTRSLSASPANLERSLDAWAAFARQALEVPAVNEAPVS